MSSPTTSAPALVKRCRRCNEVKPTSAFRPQKGSRDGLHSWCRPCCQESSNQSKAKKPEHYADVHRRSSAAWRAAHPDYGREYAMRLRHGVGLAEKAEILEAQGGVCAICKGDSGDENMHLDHEHSSGRLRGVLCGKCNRALGYFDDDLDRLAQASRYVRKEQEEDA